jgi:hypothetical protein
MAVVLNFSDGFKNKRASVVALQRGHMKNYYTHYESAIKVYKTTGEEIKDSVVAKEAAVKLYQFVNRNLIVNDRVLLAFDDLAWDFTASFVVGVLRALEGMDNYSIGLTEQGLNVQGSELRRILSDSIRVLGDKGMLAMCGFVEDVEEEGQEEMEALDLD